MESTDLTDRHIRQLRVQGCAVIHGTTDLKGNLNVKSDCVIGKKLTVDSLDCLHDLTVKKSVKIDGPVDLFSTTRILNTSLDSFHTYGGVIIETNCTIGSLLKTKSLLVEKDCKINGPLICNSIETNINNSNYTTTNTCLVQQNLTCKGNISAINIVSSKLDINGNISASDCTFGNIIGQQLQVGGDLIVSKDTTLNGSCIISKNTTIKGNSNIEGTLSIGLDANILGSIEIKKGLSVGQSTSVQDLDVKKDAIFHQNCIIKGGMVIDSTSNSTNYSTGALIVKGGTGINGNLFVTGSGSITGPMYLYSGLSIFGNIVCSSTTDSLNPSDGSLVLSGGMGIMKSLNVNMNASISNNLNVNGTCKFDKTIISNTSDSVSLNSGALIVKGGASISKSLICGDILCTSNLRVCGSIVSDSPLDSDNFKTGGCTIAGGLGVAKNVCVGGSLNVTGSFNCGGGTLTVKNGIIDCKNIKINDKNGLCNISSRYHSGLRLSLSDTVLSKSRYYSSLELFSLGSSFTDTNLEALQISNNESGDYLITTRSLGTGTSGSLSLKSGLNGGQITLTSQGNVQVRGKLILDNDNPTLTWTIENETFTLVLPKNRPPKGVRSTLVCNEDGVLEWVPYGSYM